MHIMMILQELTILLVNWYNILNNDKDILNKGYECHIDNILYIIILHYIILQCISFNDRAYQLFLNNIHYFLYLGYYQFSNITVKNNIFSNSIVVL